MANTSVQTVPPDAVPAPVLHALQTRMTTSVTHDGVTYVVSQGGKRITAKRGTFATATYNKNGRRTDQPVTS